MSNFWLWFTCPACQGNIRIDCRYCKAKGRVNFVKWMAWDR